MRLRRIDNLLFFALPMLAGFAYLLAFYPGVLSYDSIFQWDQAMRFALNNWHPAYHTIWIWLLTRIYPSPAVVAGFQILLFSGLVWYGMRTLLRMGAPAWLLLVLTLLISVAPENGMMQVTLWKDFPYSLAMVLLTLFLLQIAASGGLWLEPRWRWLWLALAAANISLLRHNGFPVAVGALGLLLVFPARRAVGKAILAAAVLTALVWGPVYQWLNVDRENAVSGAIVLVHPLAAYVDAGVPFSEQERAYLDRIRPLSEGWPYSCYDATVLFYQGVNFRAVEDDPLTGARLLGRLALAYPTVMARHFACLSSFVWQIQQPTGASLETVYTNNQDLAPYPEWQRYAPVIERRPRLPGLHDMLVRVLAWDAQRFPGRVLWRPALYLYGLILAVAVLAWRRNDARYLVILAPVLVQSLVIALTTHHQGLRYQYPVNLAGMLLVIPLLVVAFGRREAEISRGAEIRAR